MALEVNAPRTASRKLSILSLACVLAALCVAQAATAQSGRRGTKKVSPAPAEAAPAARPDKPEPRITSLIVFGHDIPRKRSKEWLSNYADLVTKGITRGLNERPGLLLGVVKGGRLKREEAFERAKREQGAYVLWFGYSARPGLYDDYVSYIDYVVLKPQTAEILTEGRVFPNRPKTTADPGGIMRLPVPPRHSPPSIVTQLEDGGREIADRVRNKL